MNKFKLLLLTILAGATLSLSVLVYASTTATTYVYLPIISKPVVPVTELRGVWLTRTDWTIYGNPSATQERIDTIISTLADTGFNVIFFQIRAEADAYYASDLEPWSRRLTGSLGGDPGFDPLAYMIQQAHANNIQVHAYVNVYTVWVDAGCDVPPPETAVPTHLHYLLQNWHGVSDTITTTVNLNGLQWNTQRKIVCADSYSWATPASMPLADHLVAVANDIVSRYDVDGLHLDRIRYADGSGNASCDPVSAIASGADCFANPNYADWQRSQINNLVARIYNEAIITATRPVLLSAAVWPIHELDPAWTNFDGHPQQGNIHYYQDSKAWLASSTIDSLSPMIYPAVYGTCDTGGSYVQGNDYWTQDRWQTLVEDFVADSNGRFIIPGIGGNYCTFAEIQARIDIARASGAAGHAIFSYRHLEQNVYFDDLKNGPYAQPATPPEITWRP